MLKMKRHSFACDFNFEKSHEVHSYQNSEHIDTFLGECSFLFEFSNLKHFCCTSCYTMKSLFENCNDFF